MSSLNNAILFNWSAALGAWALGGPLWAIIAFLTVALARLSLESQALRHERGELQRQLRLTGGPFGFPERAPSRDASPISETRLGAPAALPGVRGIAAVRTASRA